MIQSILISYDLSFVSGLCIDVRINIVRSGIDISQRYVSLTIFVFLYNSVIVGEAANFIAYAFAPAVLVTPLGALSIIVSAVLAHFILKEKLHYLGILGCVMCIAGSVVIVIHAPQERSITSVQEIWNLATQTGLLTFACLFSCGYYLFSVCILTFSLVNLLCGDCLVIFQLSYSMWHQS
ncbi:hypothetical protein QJS04_geneDACA007411 [Acorus gramineus]|uniref:Probable magnesium transporter n=1 Tax=Acorus gramineus TaxID=55184 RepID=A0AAV9BP63_ACOGR|nr:hypothetical protein QJS04_geneDACA007411 [Acorus gramineus]